MGETMLEQIRAAKKAYELAIVSYFNDGTIKSDEHYYAKKLDGEIKGDNEAVLNVLKEATSSYSMFRRDFDTINMQMLFGLIYDFKDVDENFNIKEGAEPKDNIVRYYTYQIESYLDGEKNSPYSYYEHGVGRQGFIDYNEFVQYVRDQELSFDGPETFEELKDRILSKEAFDINITANILEKTDDQELTSDEMKLVRK